MGFSPESLYWDSNAGLEIALKEVTNPRVGCTYCNGQKKQVEEKCLEKQRVF